MNALVIVHIAIVGLIQIGVRIIVWLFEAIDNSYVGFSKTVVRVIED